MVANSRSLNLSKKKSAVPVGRALELECASISYHTCLSVAEKSHLEAIFFSVYQDIYDFLLVDWQYSPQSDSESTLDALGNNFDHRSPDPIHVHDEFGQLLLIATSLRKFISVDVVKPKHRIPLMPKVNALLFLQGWVLR